MSRDLSDARIIVRGDAQKHGWSIATIDNSDVFTRGGDEVVIGWREGRATGAAVKMSNGSETLETSAMCIVRTREWLSAPQFQGEALEVLRLYKVYLDVEGDETDNVALYRAEARWAFMDAALDTVRKVAGVDDAAWDAFLEQEEN